MSMVTGIPIKSIVPPQKDDAGRKVGIEQLSESIKAIGLINALTVKPAGKDRFTIVAGRRRYYACLAAGIQNVNCMILEEDQLGHADAIEVSENLHRMQLTPMQEAEAIEKLRKLKHSDETIAADLGISRTFLARRAKLSDLSPKWKEALTQSTDGDSEFLVHLWPVACLELVARYPEDKQDRVLEQNGFQADMSVEDLRQIVGQDESNLSSAIWDLSDATLCPSAGACDTCPKRAGAQPLLFFDDCDSVVDLKKDTCLDMVCWKAKYKAAIERKVKEKTREFPNLVKISAGGARGHTLGFYQYDAAAKGDKGAVPAIRVDGPKVGTMTYVKVRQSQISSRGESGKKDDKKKSPAQLAKDRELRRWAVVLEELSDIIGGARYGKKSVDRCAAPSSLFGPSVAETDRLRMAVALACVGSEDTRLEKVLPLLNSALTMPVGDLIKAFWGYCRGSISYAIPWAYTLRQEKDLRVIKEQVKPFLAIADVTFDDLWANALKEIPEPKDQPPAPVATKEKAAAKKQTAKKKSAVKGTPKSAPDYMAPMSPSAELAAVIGEGAKTRPEVTKCVWDYIQKHKLQDTKNRRMINADEKLQVVFGGRKQISMFEMTKVIAGHLKPVKAQAHD